MSLYEQTLAPDDSPWMRLSDTARTHIKRGFWIATFATLCLGLHDPAYWRVTIGITAVNAFVVLALVGFRPLVFPAQLRLAYLGYLLLGTLVPELVVMMYITTVGLGAMLAFGYCPLARTLYLLPFNREESFSLHLLVRTFLQAPTPGRFKVVSEDAAPAPTPAEPLETQVGDRRTEPTEAEVDSVKFILTQFVQPWDLPLTSENLDLMAYCSLRYGLNSMGRLGRPDLGARPRLHEAAA